MKKLIDNENSQELTIENLVIEELKIKELEIKEKSQKDSWIMKVKKFLEEYKIFFETVVMVFLTVMSIVISFVGLQINNKTKEIYERQLEIETNDREPYFTIKSEKILERPYDNSENYDTEITYELKNEGGLMINPYISSIEKYLSIYFSNYDSVYKFKIYDFFINAHSEHDGETGKIKFYEYRNDEYDDFVKELEQGIKNCFDDVYVLESNYINISYVNYKNEQCLQRFEFTDKEIKISHEEKEGIYIGQELGDDAQQIIEKIQKVIEDIKK